MYFYTINNIKTMKWVTLLLVTISTWISAFAYNSEHPIVESSYSYRRYTTQDGLPQMLSESLVQDDKGYIWVGTLSGFARYDGFLFKQFLREKSENIVSFCKGEEGQICAFGFRRKHCVLKNGSIVTSPISSNALLLNNQNSSLLPNGYILLENESEQNRKICKMAKNGIQVIFDNRLLDKMDYHRKVYMELQEKRVYIPTSECVYIVSLNQAAGNAYVNDVNIVNIKDVYSVIRCNETVLFIAANGIFKYSSAGVDPLVKYKFEAPDFGIGVCPMGDGVLLLHDSHSIYKFSNGKIETVASGFNMIKNMIIDREGNLWVATYQGVYNFFHLGFKNYLLSDRDDIIRVVQFAEENKVLAGTLNGSVIGIEPSGISKVLMRPARSDSYFKPYGAKIGNTVYLLGAGDILSYSEGRIRWLGLQPDDYQFIGRAGDDLIVGTRRKVLKIGRDGRVLLEMDGLRGAFCAQGDGAGNIWVGTAFGTIRIENGRCIEIKRGDSTLLCTSMTGGGDGSVFLASGNKLYRTRGESIIFVKSYESQIRSLLMTDKGYLVVATIEGIHLSRDDGKGEMFFNRYNGFTAIEPMLATMAESDDGVVWVASVDQCTAFSPEKLMSRYPVPKLNLVSVTISSDNVHWRDYEITNLKNITFGRRERNLKFSYIAVTFSYVDNVKYRYRLAGFQNQWSHPVSEREITFNNLSPGAYRFEIEAIIGDKVSAPIILPFVIKAAVWQQLWFWAISILAVVTLLWLIAYTQIRRRSREREERLLREIKLNSLQIKSIRLKAIPHFNSNVLAGIEYFIMNRSIDEADKYLSLYSKFTNTTLLDVDKPSRPVSAEIEYVRMYLTLEKLRYGDDLSFSIHLGDNVDPNIEVPNMVLHTYCENAIKHGLRNKHGGGHINVEVLKREEGIVIAVSDDGVGRAAAAMQKTNSTKQGLKILLMQIELYNQINSKYIVQTVTDLTNNDSTPIGTKFELFVPFNYKYY